jgi:hypothetical protein
MNGNWKEAETRIINLLDDEGKIFARYINYVTSASYQLRLRLWKS